MITIKKMKEISMFNISRDVKDMRKEITERQLIKAGERAACNGRKTIKPWDL